MDGKAPGPRPQVAAYFDCLEPPRPLVTLVAHSGSATAISRRWAGDDAQSCRLCPRGQCSATQGVCLVIVEERIALEDAALLDLNGRRWIDEDE